jgi:hypothetical protein
MSNTVNDGPFKVDVIQRTAAQWTATDPFLGQGDIGIESDTGKIKIGNAGKWSTTPYLTSTTGVSGEFFVRDGDDINNLVVVQDGRIVSWEAI